MALITCRTSTTTALAIDPTLIISNVTMLRFVCLSSLAWIFLFLCWPDIPVFAEHVCCWIVLDGGIGWVDGRIGLDGIDTK